MAIVSILVLVLIIVALVKLSTRPKNFPPGPRGLPLLGNITLLSTNEPVTKILQSLAKSYGPVTGLYLGPTTPMISVSGQDAIREALLNDDLNGRPSGAILRNRTFGEKLGLIFSDGPFWQEQRRFTLRHLRDLGFGKTSIEDQMMDEIQDLIKEIKESSESDRNHTVEFKSMFSVSVINILWAIIGGKRFQRDDMTFKNLVLDVERFAKSGNIGMVMFPVPQFLVRNFPIIPKLLGTGNDLFDPLQKFVFGTMDEHLETKSKGDAPRDFLDVYLDEMNNQTGTNENTTFTRKQLVGTIQDLFAAGSDTSSNAIGFSVLYMVHYPDVQRKLQNELDDVCGDALPSLAHRPNLPYTEAFIMEILRVANVIPFSVPHCALKDTTIRGYHIPKESVVIFNFESMLQDKAVWNDPENFRPERHLNVDGKVIRNEALIPFGIGKRACLGEPLARNTVFLFVAALAKTFEFKPASGEPLPSFEPLVGFTIGPRPFKASVVPRNTLHTK